MLNDVTVSFMDMLGSLICPQLHFFRLQSRYPPPLSLIHGHTHAHTRTHTHTHMTHTQRTYPHSRIAPRTHGWYGLEGGYQYRLCPATEELLTEDCFMRTPLDFVRGKQALEWKNGTRMLVPDPQYIDEGIIPVGSTWARNPIPVISGQHAGCVNTTGNLTTNATDVYGMLCRQFEPPCLGDDGWDTTPGSADQTDLMGKCSGEWIEGVIVDQVVIPSNLKPGRYV